MKNLKFNYLTAYMNGVKGHAQEVMEKLGITYQHATPQTMGDQWWFWNCENIPEELPEYITELKSKPMDCIGFGLSEEDAIKIKKRRKIKYKE